MSSCSEGDQYVQHAGFKIVMLYQIVPAILSILTNGLFLVKRQKRIYFHSNLKFIISCSLVFHIVFCIFLTALQSTHLFLFMVKTDGCDVYVPVPFCLVVRGPSTYSMLSFVPFNVAMIIERTVATIRIRDYEESLKGLRYVLVIFVLVWALAMTFFSMWNTPLTGVSAYCSAANSHTASNISINSYFLSCVEICTILWFIGLWLRNKHLQKNKNFNFKTSYQVNENLNALRLLLPWILFHFIVFTTFYIGNAVTPKIWDDPMSQKTAYAALAFVPYYTLFTPFLLSYIVWKQQKTRVQHLQRMVRVPATGAAYMDYLNRQW